MQTFDDIVKHWWNFVCSIAYKETGEPNEHIASIVFERLHANWQGAYDTNAHIITWLKTTTTHLCIDYLRNKNMHRKYLHRYKQEIYNGEEPSTKEDNAEKERLEVKQYVINFLYDEIQKLPELTRNVFLLYCKGFNYRKIAYELKINKNTVTKQMEFARNTLKIKVFENKKAAPILAQQLLFKPGENKKKAGV